MASNGTIFITVGEWFVLRNVLRTPFYSAVRERLPDVRIVFIVRSGEKERYVPELAEFSNTIVEEAGNPRAISFFERVISSCARNGLRTGTNTVMQNRAWEAGESRILPVFKKTFGMIGKSRLFQSCVRALEMHIAPHPHTARLFDTYRPALVFGTTLVNTEVDVPILREAKRRGIRTVAITRSWDNLTGSGLLRVLPDVFIAQSAYIADIAARLHFVRGKIPVVGLPHYDHYKDASLVIPRAAFFAQYGISADKKLVVYAAIGESLFRKEAEMADIFEVLCEHGAIRDAGVIYRTHPSFPLRSGRIGVRSHVIADDGSEVLAEEEKFLAPRVEKLGSLVHLINSLAHADVVVTAGSTMMIDAIAFGKPVVTVAFDGNSGDSFWFSTARFYDHFNHIVRFLMFDAVEVVYSKTELAAAINHALENPDRLAPQRGAVIEHFIAPFDGQSGERLARLLADAYATSA